LLTEIICISGVSFVQYAAKRRFSVSLPQSRPIASERPETSESDLFITRLFLIHTAHWRIRERAMNHNEKMPKDDQPTPRMVPLSSQDRTVDLTTQNGQEPAPRMTPSKTVPLTGFQNRVKTSLERFSTSVNLPQSKISPLLAGSVLGLSIALLIVLFRPLSPTPPTVENQVSEQRGTVAEDWFQQARQASVRGDRQSAIANYTQAIQRSPKNPNFYYNRGIEHSASGDRPSAIKDYTQAIKLDKNFADAYYNRANAQAVLGQNQAAIADYQRAANLYQRQGLKDFQQEAIAAAKTLQQSVRNAKP
jgi:Tfp pilus assembly protein PilF